jgi:hypothetical protein
MATWNSTLQSSDCIPRETWEFRAAKLLHVEYIPYPSHQSASMPIQCCMQCNSNTKRAVAVVDRPRGKEGGKQQWAVKIQGRIHWQPLFGAFAAAAGGPCCGARKQGKCPLTTSQRIRNGQAEAWAVCTVQLDGESALPGPLAAWLDWPLPSFSPLSCRSFKGSDRIGVSLLRIFFMEVSAFLRSPAGEKYFFFCAGTELLRKVWIFLFFLLQKVRLFGENVIFC